MHNQRDKRCTAMLENEKEIGRSPFMQVESLYTTLLGRISGVLKTNGKGARQSRTECVRREVMVAVAVGLFVLSVEGKREKAKFGGGMDRRVSGFRFGQSVALPSSARQACPVTSRRAPPNTPVSSVPASFTVLPPTLTSWASHESSNLRRAMAPLRSPRRVAAARRHSTCLAG